VGAKLNLTENAARMRVDRALDKLRVRLSEHGVTSTAAALAVALANQAVVAAPAGLATTITGAALTGAAASGGAWAALQFIAMNKLQVGIASTVIVAAGSGAVLQQQANDHLQREIDALRQENGQIAGLQEENLRLKQTAAEVATLRADDAELAQLGTEATALKVRLQAQARAQAASNASTAAGSQLTNFFNLGDLDQIPVARYQARPVYPFAMSRAGITGEVTVALVVDTNGDVREAHVVKSTQQEFEAAAVEAVLKWKFRAGERGGKAVNTRMQVPIVFALSGPSIGGKPKAETN
jgi:TonB family protein